MNRIAVMTSGGDCPGMNAAIRSVVRTGIANGLEVFGIEQGYKGLMENRIKLLESKDVANMIQRGGTFLKSARSLEFKTDEGQQMAVGNLEANGIEGLVVIGGDGSLTGARILHEKFGIKVVGLPGSIDNDIYGTSISIGVDTALNTICRAVDMINETASSHDRTFLIEVMGRNCGYLALMSAIASGAEAVIIPEVKYNIESIINKIKVRYVEGKSRSVVIVAEGAGSAYDIGKAFQLIGGFDTRITVLGHLQRGGAPSVFDRTLATRLGSAAVKGLIEGRTGVMAGLGNREISFTPLSEVLTKKRDLDETMLKIAEELSL
ncbi:6-phosphofructokinase [Seleniivibrio woodruffii]|uniref:ATP-dependent 6-phosphofructokinase n=1 Tax=Seleniivibrio woodruffii TaxID=1078050 RepID=A0A4R1K9E4_9BACT|nr:6-phosphofructokinase [Seleniivibrio woodruffii]TCK60974.1 6-phosphofructokinase [Seleniivibrio woodruffii]TVZ36604.1 6-phosphofructokinase [Seleniivibrio woodruffii]